MNHENLIASLEARANLRTPEDERSPENRFFEEVLNMCIEQKQDLELAAVLLHHAVEGIFHGCGNSYANAYTEQWLTRAKKLGGYQGPVIGNIIELEKRWQDWLDENGLPEWDRT